MARRLLYYSLIIPVILWSSFGNGNPHQRHCPREHAQTKYCKADFVLKATLKTPSINSTDSLTQFAMVIKTQIKISAQFLTLHDVTLKSVWVDKRLSKSIADSTKYVLTGHIKEINGEKVLYVSQCDWLVIWDTVSHRQRALMRKQKYETGCSCNTEWKESTRLNSCRIPWNKLKFLDKFSESNSVHSCFDDYSFCAANKHIPHCSWTINRELTTCLKKITK